MDKFTKLTAWIDAQVEEARADFARMIDTADTHPCDACTAVLGNKRVRLATLLNVQYAAKDVR